MGKALHRGMQVLERGFIVREAPCWVGAFAAIRHNRVSEPGRAFRRIARDGERPIVVCPAFRNALRGEPVAADYCVSVELRRLRPNVDRKSTRLNSSHGYISYAVFCLK